MAKWFLVGAYFVIEHDCEGEYDQDYEYAEESQSRSPRFPLAATPRLFSAATQWL